MAGPIGSMWSAGAARLLTLPITVVSALLLTRIIIGEVGVETYGVLAVVMSLPYLVPIGDLGTGTAVTNAAADAGPEFSTRLCEYLSAALRISVAGALLLSTTACIFMWSGFWNQLLPSNSAADVDVSAGATLVVCIYALTMPLSVFSRLMVGRGHAPAVSIIGAVGALMGLLTAQVFDWTSAPGYVFAICVVMGGVFSGLFSAAYCYWRYRLPWRRILLAVLGRQGRGVSFVVVTTAVPMLLIMLAQPVALQSDRLVIMHVRPADLPEYSLGAAMHASALSLLVAAALPLWPLLRSSGSTMIQAEQWKQGSRFMVLAGGLLAGALAVVGGPVALWTSKHEILLPKSLLLAFALLLLIQGATLAPAMFLTSPQEMRWQAGFVLTMTLVNLPLSIVLASKLGAPGPVLSSALSILACQAWPLRVMVRRKLRTQANDHVPAPPAFSD